MTICSLKLSLCPSKIANLHRIFRTLALPAVNSYNRKCLTTSSHVLKNAQLFNFLSAFEKEYKSRLSETSESKRKSSVWQDFQNATVLMTLIEDINKTNEELHQLNQIISDQKSELVELAEEEKIKYQTELENLESMVINELVPVETTDTMDIILELSAGVGGQEAMLFTGEMFNMYCNYAQYKNWTYEIMKYDDTDINGLRHATLSIVGPLAYKYLKHEGGVHRVQRVPKTEKSGRVHTSTMTVAVLPQPSEIQIKINQKDLNIDTMRASGAGGQHVNKTESAVRITHLPTGLTSECQISRSQHSNMKLAMAALRARLYDRVFREEQLKRTNAKRLQVGTAARSDKVRTYNFPQDRITDHRIVNNYHNMEEFLSGGQQLDSLIQEILEDSKKFTLNVVLENHLLKLKRN